MNRATRVVKVRAGAVVDLREVRFWSQEDLAAAAGIKLLAVQRVERGRLSRYDDVVAVAKALRVELAALVDTITPAATRSAHTATRLTDGSSLRDLLAGSDLVSAENPELGTTRDRKRLRNIIQELRDLAFVWHDLDEKQQASETRRYSRVLAELERHGFALFGNRREIAWASQDGRFRTRLELGTILVRPIEFRGGLPVGEILFHDDNEGNVNDGVGAEE